MSFSFSKALQADFDPIDRIVHLSASQILQVNDYSQLIELCQAVEDKLEEFGPERMYMIVDLAKFSINPDLSEEYKTTIGLIGQKFLYPDGWVRYGYQITRVTIMLANDTEDTDHIGLFSTKKEAYQRIQELINQNKPQNPIYDDTPSERDNNISAKIDISQNELK